MAQLLRFKAPSAGAERLPFAAADVARVVNPLADAVVAQAALIGRLREELDAVRAELAGLKARPPQAGLDEKRHSELHKEWSQRSRKAREEAKSAQADSPNEAKPAADPLAEDPLA